MERKNFILTSLLAGIASTGISQTLNNKPGKKNLDPFYIPPNPEPLISHEGTQIRLKIRTKQTDNQLGCVEFSLAPKTMGPAPHIHKDLDEIMFVQDGEVNVMVGDEVTVVKAGGYHMRPHGIIHCFWNATDATKHSS